LEELWLGKNKITKLEVSFPTYSPVYRISNFPSSPFLFYLQNISTLSSLRVLSIQSNRLTTLSDSGLSELKNLEELYVSHNGLTKIEGLEGCTKLKTLDIGANKVEKIEGISHLKDLEEFWVSTSTADAFF